MSKIYDNIIVGTGIGGLTAGLSVARKGHSVLLLEAGKQFGGMLNPFARRHYHFDVGIHYVGEAGEGQAMRRMLDGLGLDDIKFREINPDCIDRYVFDGYESKLVKGHDRWADTLVADFPKEERNIRRFIEFMKAIQDVQRIAINGPSFRRLKSPMRWLPSILRSLNAPFSKILERFFDDPLLRNVFAGPGGDIGLPPGRASGMISMMVLNHFLGGAYYPIGGSGAIRDSYVKALKGHGAELMRNRLVSKIEVLGDRRFAVETTKGERFEARSVVSNVDATHTMEMVEGAKPSRSVRKKAANFRPSFGSFCVFLGTDLDLNQTELTDANIWHYGTNDLDYGYEEAFKGKMPENPFFFVTAPSLKDPETVRAPNGHHTLEMITFVPSEPFKPYFDMPAMKRGAEYDALKNEYADKLIAGAERYVPGLSDHIVIQENATPATVWSFVRGRDGGIYGPEHSPDQMLHNRLGVKTGIDGLYLAGASVLGAGIQTCLTSGVMAGIACKKYLRANSPAPSRIATAAAS